MKLTYMLLFALAASLVLLAGCAAAPPAESAPEAAAPAPMPVPSGTPAPDASVGPGDSMVPEPAETMPGEEPMPPSGGVTKLTAEEVAKHAVAEDCWVIVDGNVYDISNFPAVHPGGPQIAGMCGKDATELFQTRAGKDPHPESAQMKLETMLLGPVGLVLEGTTLES